MKKLFLFLVLLVSFHSLFSQSNINTISDSSSNINNRSLLKSIKGDKLNTVCPTNVLSSLSGRFPGLQVTTGTGNFGGGTRVIIRGLRSFMIDNQPLIVVDGIPFNNSDFSTGATGSGGYDLGSMANDLNLWDIDSISILTPSHSAIYGSRGINGVISILTKRGKFSDSFRMGVNYNSNISFEKIAIYPKYQKLYGGGYTGNFESTTINGANYLIPQYYEDESWGPRFNSNISVLPWNAFDSWDTKNYLKTIPWVYPSNDYTSFFKTGNGYQNNVQLNGSYKFFNAIISYTNCQNTGIYPNSYQNRDIFSVNSNFKLKKFAEFHFEYRYIDSKTNGRSNTGYSQGNNNVIGNMWTWSQTSLDYSNLKSYLNQDGSQRTWNRIAWNDPKPMYKDNPYWDRYRNTQNDFHTRNLINTSLQINIFTWLNVNGRFGADSYKLTNNNRMAVGSVNQSSFSIDKYSYHESNLDLFLNAQKRFVGGAFGFNTLAGFSTMNNSLNWFEGYTNGGLTIPGIYALANSVNPGSVNESHMTQKISSLYADIEFDYRNLYFLELIVRKEKPIGLFESTDPSTSKSINLSSVLTNFDFIKNAEIISYSRIYTGFTNYMNFIEYFDLGVKYNPDLKPEKQNHFEVGAEFYFYKNRLGFEVNYFYNINSDQVTLISLSPTSGYNYKLANCFKTKNNGLEIEASSTPVKTNEFYWNLMVNLSTLKSKVISMNYGFTTNVLGTGVAGLEVAALKGKPFPYIVGTNYIYNSKGEKLISDNGKYVKSSQRQPLAKVTPDFTAGITNTFCFKKFTVSFLVDIQKGGHMYYSSYKWGRYSGILEETARVNENGKNIRDDIADGGGLILDGVNSSSSLKKTTRIDALTWATSGPDMQNVFSTDYVKLREVSIAYNIPVKFTHLIKGLKVSAYGRDLAVWGAATKHFDPEYLQMAGSNAQGLEGGYLPSVKTYGFALNMSF